jgi:kynurenine formamidase
MRVIDLSTLIEDTEGSEFDRTGIAYRDHAVGAESIQNIFGIPPTLLRNQEGWAVEEFTHFSTHSCTHVDAPYHYNSTILGERAQTIDELPLEWFFNDGIVLDMTHKADGDVVTGDDVEAELSRIGCELKPLDIVLVRTGCDRYYGQPDYMFHGCGVTAEATRRLFEQGVRVMGIDAWGWDLPLHMQAKTALAAGKPGAFWAAHQVDLPYCQIERLVNLGGLPPSGFKVACFPLKIKGASAGPARVVAILEN